VQLHGIGSRGHNRTDYARGDGIVESVGKQPIDVYGLQWRIDGEVFTISVGNDGLSRFAAPNGDVGFTEPFSFQFEFYVKPPLERVAGANSAAVRAIGTWGSTEWIEIRSDSLHQLRTALGLASPPSATDKPQAKPAERIGTE
jgi:hypothetical protein